MPPWLAGVLGGIGGAAAGFFGSSAGRSDSDSTPATPRAPVWPWIAGGIAVFVIILVVLTRHKGA